MIPLPTWMSCEMAMAWEDYISQRVKDRKAMTLRSAAGRLKRLQELKDAGHDPMQCLEEAINGHWLDFYAPKDKPIERKAGAAGPDPELQRLNERARTATKPPPGLRRVA